jgi:hypothetical protein
VAARCWWSRGKRKGEQQKGGAQFGFIAAHCFVEERERSGGHGIGLKTASDAGGALGCVAAAWLRRPDMARQGEDSGGGAVVGEVAWRRVGEGSSAGLHSGGLRGSDGEVCCTGGREHTGRRRATWPSGERSARGREAAGQRPERHVHGRRGLRERQRRRTWPGSGGGVWQRRNRGGREREVDEGDPNAISEKCRDLTIMHQ